MAPVSRLTGAGHGKDVGGSGFSRLTGAGLGKDVGGSG